MIIDKLGLPDDRKTYFFLKKKRVHHNELSSNEAHEQTR